MALTSVTSLIRLTTLLLDLVAIRLAQYISSYQPPNSLELISIAAVVYALRTKLVAISRQPTLDAAPSPCLNAFLEPISPTKREMPYLQLPLHRPAQDFLPPRLLPRLRPHLIRHATPGDVCGTYRGDFTTPHRISCKQVFCYECALRTFAAQKTCPLCLRRVSRLRRFDAAISKGPLRILLLGLILRCFWQTRLPIVADWLLTAPRACSMWRYRTISTTCSPPRSDQHVRV